MKDWLLPWKTADASVRPLVRLDWAARSLAEPVTPRKVGMAMANKMAIMSKTTISSIKVKPAWAISSLSTKDWNMTSPYMSIFKAIPRHRRGPTRAFPASCLVKLGID